MGELLYLAAVAAVLISLVTALPVVLIVAAGVVAFLVFAWMTK